MSVSVEPRGSAAGESAPAGSGHVFGWEALHLLTLWAFAVVQPLFELMARNGEFFVAHRARPLDLVALTLVVWLLLPGLALLGAWAIGLASRRGQLWTTTVLLGALTAAISLQAVKRWLDWGGIGLVALACLLGVAGALLYRRVAALRTFVTVLALGLVIFPALFLTSGPIRSLLVARAGAFTAGPPVESETPVVLVVFDQLPVVSLMGSERQIDAALYPNFAAFAEGATWFRDATAVGNKTQWALPPIVTGRYPDREGRLPTADDYPDTLFSLFGSSYRLQVFEPITQLCPEELCAGETGGLGVRLRAQLVDLKTVYGHLLLPDDLAARLPSVSQSWHDFGTTRDRVGEYLRFKERADTVSFLSAWTEERDRDRRVAPRELVAGIEDNGGPTLIFLHVLLPHEPYLYLPSGQSYTVHDFNPALRADGKWADDPLSVAESYRRHLWQLGYVDGLLGQLLDRLRETGLYDRSLIVVTADHGASFKVGKEFKDPEEGNLADIMSVPLLVKTPFQTAGEVSDRNVETVDVLPTILHHLGIEPRWEMDGVAAVDSLSPKRNKELYVGAGRTAYRVIPEELDAKYEALDEKLALFDTSTPWLTPKYLPHAELLGKRVGEVETRGPSANDVTLDYRAFYEAVSLRSDFVPAQISGTVESPTGGSGAIDLAVAVNGRIVATTRSTRWPVQGRNGFWSVLVESTVFREGDNDVQVFIVDSSGGASVLETTSLDATVPERRNLALASAVHTDDAEHAGMYGQQWAQGRPFRWTQGNATITVPLPTPAPRALRVSLLRSAEIGTRLTIRVNGCELFDDEVDGGEWEATFSLQPCRLADEATIEISSGTALMGGTQDRRPFGVALSAVELLR